MINSKKSPDSYFGVRQKLVFICLAFYLILTCHPCDCILEWSWSGGSKTVDKLSNEGTPGSRSGSSVWHSGEHVWLFGGKGFSDLSTESGKSQMLNDVWHFSTSTLVFDLQHPGSWTSNPDPSLGPSVLPRGRQHAALCGHLDMLIVFGGIGQDGSALDDLWAYNIRSKEWTELFDYLNNSTQRSGPSARGHSAVWCYDSFMHVFGGIDEKKNIFNDMWKLNLSTLKWTEVYSHKIVSSAQKSHRSISASLYPVGRNGAATWESKGTFYLFGGNINSSLSSSLQPALGLTDDLWKFHPDNNRWYQITNASALHSASDSLRGAPRCVIGAASWTDSKGNLWLFGGTGVEAKQDSSDVSVKLLANLWWFHVDSHDWKLVREHGGNVKGSYSHDGQTAMPGARTEMMAWQLPGDVFYIFGGLGKDGLGQGGYLNDLWNIDVTAITSRNYMISAESVLLVLGLSAFLLVVVLALAVCARRGENKWCNDRHLGPNGTNTKYSILVNTSGD